MEAGSADWEDQVMVDRKLGGRIFSGDLGRIGDPIYLPLQLPELKKSQRN